MFGSAVASSSRTLLRASRPALRSSIRSLSTTSTLRNAAPVDAKISGIVDQIEKLTLLEAADLVSALKTRLNITEIAMPAASAPAAAAAPAAAEEVEEAAKPKEKTVFTLKLTGLKDPTAKAKVIREVKATNSNMCVSIISRAALSPRSPNCRLNQRSLWRIQCRQKELILTLSRRCAFAFDTGTWSRPRSSSSPHPRCSRRASTRKTPRSSRRPSRLPAALSSSSKSLLGLLFQLSLFPDRKDSPCEKHGDAPYAQTHDNGQQHWLCELLYDLVLRQAYGSRPTHRGDARVLRCARPCLGWAGAWRSRCRSSGRQCRAPSRRWRATM